MLASCDVIARVLDLVISRSKSCCATNGITAERAGSSRRRRQLMNKRNVSLEKKQALMVG